MAPPRCTGPSFREPLPDPRVAVGREGRATAGEEARPSADASAVLLVDSFQDPTVGRRRNGRSMALPGCEFQCDRRDIGLFGQTGRFPLIERGRTPVWASGGPYSPRSRRSSSSSSRFRASACIRAVRSPSARARSSMTWVSACIRAVRSSSKVAM